MSQGKYVLAWNLQVKMEGNHVEHASVMRIFCANLIFRTIFPQVKQQPNAHDCGVYLLEFASLLLQHFECQAGDLEFPYEFLAQVSDEAIKNRREKLKFIFWGPCLISSKQTSPHQPKASSKRGICDQILECVMQM
jgi:hypothetical protein